MNREELIWKYLDGRCEADEKKQVEKWIETDLDFRAALLERRQLATHLKAQEVEQPPLRFVRNVMDRLPELYQRRVQPLVSPFWIRTFLVSIAFVLAGYFGLVFHALQTGAISEPGTASQITEPIIQTLNGIPSSLLTIIGALSLGYLALVAFDRMLKSRFSQMQNKQRE